MYTGSVVETARIAHPEGLMSTSLKIHYRPKKKYTLTFTAIDHVQPPNMPYITDQLRRSDKQLNKESM